MEFDVFSLVGCSLTLADSVAGNHGKDLRVTWMDGESSGLPGDDRKDCVDVAVWEGKVVGVRGIG